MVPSGNCPAASQDVSEGRSVRSGVSKGRSHLSPYTQPRRHLSHILPVFGGPTMAILTALSPPASTPVSSFSATDRSLPCGGKQEVRADWKRLVDTDHT